MGIWMRIPLILSMGHQKKQLRCGDDAPAWVSPPNTNWQQNPELWKAANQKEWRLGQRTPLYRSIWDSLVQEGRSECRACGRVISCRTPFLILLLLLGQVNQRLDFSSSWDTRYHYQGVCLPSYSTDRAKGTNIEFPLLHVWRCGWALGGDSIDSIIGTFPLSGHHHHLHQEEERGIYPVVPSWDYRRWK